MPAKAGIQGGDDRIPACAGMTTENAVSEEQQTPPRPDAADENHIIATRREKLAAMRAAGQAYPNDFHRDTLAEFLHGNYGERDAASLENETATFSLAGRLMARRVMGKASLGSAGGSAPRYRSAPPTSPAADAGS